MNPLLRVSQGFNKNIRELTEEKICFHTFSGCCFSGKTDFLAAVEFMAACFFKPAITVDERGKKERDSSTMDIKVLCNHIQIS